MKKVIYGPPGSGKTETAIGIAEEAMKTGAKISDFTISTFRKQLAASMKKRLEEKIGEAGKDNYIGTTHSICKKLLGGNLVKVADTDEKTKFCAMFGVKYDPSWDRSKEGRLRMEPIYANEPRGNQLFAVYDYSANNMVSVKEALFQAPMDEHARQTITTWEVERFAVKWDEYKAEAGVMDFSDMMRQVLKQELSPGTKYLIEDEFHDKTPLQYAVYKIWEKHSEMVVVLGDPLQAIYGFWGTSPQFFMKEKKEADEYVELGKSWRFGPNLWEYAKKILRREGMNPPDMECMGETIISKMSWEEFKQEILKFENNNCAYLVRANKSKEIIADVLSFHGIVHGEIRGSSIDLYNAVCDMKKRLPRLSLLGVQGSIRVAASHAKEIVEHFPRECFTRTKHDMKNELTPDITSYVLSITPRVVTVLNKPFVDLKNLSTKRKANLIKIFEKRKGRPIDNISAHNIDTIHAKKGGEEDVVFLFDDIPPLVYKTADKANEARIYYVGVTRTKKELIVVHGPTKELSYPLPAIPTKCYGGKTDG